jgi:phosphate transport system substrate-binding protein
MEIFRTIALLFLIILLGILATFAEAKEVKVTVSGSSTVMPLAELAAEEFNLMQDEYHVSVTSGGTGVGIIDIAQGRSDIAMASREITPVERQRYETAKERFQELPIAIDAICIVLSDDVYDSGVTDLTRDQVKRIYAGDIINWMDVGGQDMEIFAIGRRAASGTRDTFHEIIMGSKEAEAPGVSMEASESSEVKTAIRGSDNAIGYMGYSYILKGDAKVIALDGVPPTMDNIKNESYPLARKLYFYTMGDPSPGARAFMDYLQGPEGEKIAVENGFIPM